MKKVIVALLISVAFSSSQIVISSEYLAQYATGENSGDSISERQAFAYDTGNIDQIKRFHSNYSLSYNAPLLFSIFDKQELRSEKNFFIYPIDWALISNKIEFATWLIKTEHVDVTHESSFKYSKFHYLVDGMLGERDSVFVEKNIINDDEVENLHLACYLELMKLLILNKAQINALDCYGNTPLSGYNIKVSKACCNLNIFKLFFDHGAQLAVKREGIDHEIKQRNIVERVVEGCDPYEIAYLFKLRLDSESPFEGLDYRKQLYHAKEQYDAYFKCLSLVNKRLGPYKIPKPLVHAISKIAISDDEKKIDIKQSLSAKGQRNSCSTKTEFISPLEFFSRNSPSPCNQKTLKLLDPKFWDDSLESCYEVISEILAENEKK